MMEGSVFGKAIPLGAKDSFVYVIRNADLNLYKIGITDNVSRRLGDLRRSSCNTLNLLTSWRVPTYAAKTFETCIHLGHAHCRTHGEWFALNPDEVANLLQLEQWSIPARQIA